MSNVIYVVPWAICQTDSMYIKKIQSNDMPAPKTGDAIDDWCIKKVIPNPDKRSKDVFAIVDVYNGYDTKINEKGTPVFELNNSVEKLIEYDYKKADESEQAFIRQKVLKIDKAPKKVKVTSKKSDKK